MFRGVEEKKIVEVEQKGLKIIDILIIQYFLCFAGMGYSIAISNINMILLFGVIMVFNGILQLRAKRYVKKF
jgi:hypothetical protein